MQKGWVTRDQLYNAVGADVVVVDERLDFADGFATLPRHACHEIARATIDLARVSSCRRDGGRHRHRT